MIDARTLVVFALPDARRLGFQLRMQMGGAYLDQVRLAVTILEERAAADAADASLQPASG